MHLRQALLHVLCDHRLQHTALVCAWSMELGKAWVGAWEGLAAGGATTQASKGKAATATVAGVAAAAHGLVMMMLAMDSIVAVMGAWAAGTPMGAWTHAFPPPAASGPSSASSLGAHGAAHSPESAGDLRGTSLPGPAPSDEVQDAQQRPAEPSGPEPSPKDSGLSLVQHMQRCADHAVEVMRAMARDSAAAAAAAGPAPGGRGRRGAGARGHEVSAGGSVAQAASGEAEAAWQEAVDDVAAAGESLVELAEALTAGGVLERAPGLPLMRSMGNKVYPEPEPYVAGRAALQQALARLLRDGAASGRGAAAGDAAAGDAATGDAAAGSSAGSTVGSAAGSAAVPGPGGDSREADKTAAVAISGGEAGQLTAAMHVLRGTHVPKSLPLMHPTVMFEVLERQRKPIPLECINALVLLLPYARHWRCGLDPEDTAALLSAATKSDATRRAAAVALRNLDPGECGCECWPCWVLPLDPAAEVEGCKSIGHVGGCLSVCPGSRERHQPMCRVAPGELFGSG